MTTLRKKCERGQGIIEYVGALVIATVLVGFTLSNGSGGVSGLFETVVSGIQGFFIDQIAMF